jgi:preprotein translocase subunit SecG
MYTFLTILMILISLFIIVVVLVQPGKGDLASGLGTVGGSMASMFGSRRASDLLQKITIGLSIALAVLVILTNLFFVGGPSGVDANKPITEGVAIPTKQTPVPAPVQSTPAPTNQQQPTAPADKK